MFTWLKRPKPPSTTQTESPPNPPTIRKPQHAYRDARMSIPIAEREFYETIQARQARRLASFAESVEGGGKWKGKARSPLGCGSGSGEYLLAYKSTERLDCCVCGLLLIHTCCDEGSTSYTSTPGSSERAFSYNGSSSSHGTENTDLRGVWEEFMRQGAARGRDGMELSELAESSRDAAVREREMEGRGEE